MTETDVFTETDGTAEEWVDVRMTNPEAGEWDVDVVIVDGQVQYVDLRVRPELLASFVDCLVEDVPEARAERVFERLAAKHGLEIDSDPHDTTDETDPSPE
jgi:hypothetical protein